MPISVLAEPPRKQASACVVATVVKALIVDALAPWSTLPLVSSQRSRRTGTRRGLSLWQRTSSGRGVAGSNKAYFYFEEEPGRRAAAKLLTRDEARRIAAKIAKLSRLLRRLHGSGCADLITGTDSAHHEPTIWPLVAYHDPHIDRPNSHPVSRAYCRMWCGICLGLPARKAAAS
jgi:hypothetical protein